MKIIDDLIEEPISKSVILTDILVKTKVLAFKLKNTELQTWVDSELNGYTDGQLPNYRILTCQITGTVSNGFQRGTNFPIPLTSLKAKERETMTTLKLVQSIATLDEIVHKSDSTKMIMNVPSEMYNFLSKDFDNGFVIEFARREIGKVQIVQVLTAIRTKLLDFLLKLNEEVGENEDVKSMTQGEGKDKVTSIFSSAVFGNNTTIIVGDGNTQTLTNSNITTRNFAELEKYFSNSGMDKKDISELKAVIDNDNQDQNNHEFGAKVKAWTQKMLGKAMDNSWKVGLAVAGKLIAEGVTRYYGWK